MFLFLSQARPIPTPMQQIMNIVQWTLVPMLVIAICLASIYWFYRKHKLSYFNEVRLSFVIHHLYVIIKAYMFKLALIHMLLCPHSQKIFSVFVQIIVDISVFCFFVLN